MTTQHMVIEALRAFDGDRFSVAKGELRVIRFGYSATNFVPKVVSRARAAESINWGGAVVFSDAYRVLFDGVGPVPAEVAARIPSSVS